MKKKPVVPTKSTYRLMRTAKQIAVALNLPASACKVESAGHVSIVIR